MSIQVVILKILASHGSGRATLASLKADIAILAASGAEWSSRIRRLAARVPAIDIFGNGLVLRHDEGWEITAEGRDFLAMLEAVTQDNLPQDIEPAMEPELHRSRPAEPSERGDLIVIGHRFKNRLHRPGTPVRKPGSVSRAANGLRGDNPAN